MLRGSRCDTYRDKQANCRRQAHEHLTRQSSAAATGSAAENLVNCSSHKKRERAAGSRRLQRLVRCARENHFTRRIMQGLEEAPFTAMQSVPTAVIVQMSSSLSTGP